MNRTLSICLSILALLIAAETAPAGPRIRTNVPLQIEIRLQDYVGLRQSKLQTALSTAAKRFKQAGVSVVWLDCTPTNPRLDGGCEAPVTPRTRILRIFRRDQGIRLNARSGELGRALLREDRGGGTFAGIFHHQVEARAAWAMSAPRMGGDRLSARLLPARLLGYAIAHEIAHLFGIHHAAGGIMHDSWSPAEIADILTGSLRFTAPEISRIRSELTERKG